MSGKTPILRVRSGFGQQIIDFGPSDVECPVCGRSDNHCDNRRGLCDACYCSLVLHLDGRDAELAAMDRFEMVREARRWREFEAAWGCAPRIPKRKGFKSSQS